MLSKHLKKDLAFKISEQQRDFAEGWEILDASLMTYEWERKKQKDVAIKLDLEKVFDEVDWNLLEKFL